MLKPEPTSAVVMAETPGTTVKGKSSSMHLRIKRAPGSESPGMPASVMRATVSFAARRSTSSAVRMASLCW